MERAIGVAYTSNLSSHSAKCGPTTKQAQSLGAFGITGGAPLTLKPEQVREYFALWTAESARPFCIVNDRFVEYCFWSYAYIKANLYYSQLQKLLHPDARKHMPHRDTISKDIRRIYQATQREITEMLEVSIQTMCNTSASSHFYFRYSKVYFTLLSTVSRAVTGSIFLV